MITLLVAKGVLKNLEKPVVSDVMGENGEYLV